MCTWIRRILLLIEHAVSPNARIKSPDNLFLSNTFVFTRFFKQFFDTTPSNIFGRYFLLLKLCYSVHFLLSILPFFFTTPISFYPVSYSSFLSSVSRRFSFSLSSPQPFLFYYSKVHNEIISAFIEFSCVV